MAPFAHQGSFDESAILDTVNSQCQYVSTALPAGGTMPQFAIGGALDCVLANTTANPGTVTTRTAAQIYADLTAQLGFPPPPNFTFFQSIAHSGAGTLTLAGGTGVTISSATGGPTTVATTTTRDYIVQVVNPNTVNIIALGAKNT